MALNWSKSINFFGLSKGGKGGRRSDAYPSKKSMNLYQVSIERGDYRTTSAVGVALAVAIALFLRFGVYGPMSQTNIKRSELASWNAQLAALEKNIADYDTVLEQYNAYSPVSATAGVDTVSMLTMVETKVKPFATVSQFTLNDATLSLSLSDVSLQTVGIIASSLDGEPGVVSVSVSTASTKNGEQGTDSVATITIKLVDNASSSTGEK